MTKIEEEEKIVLYCIQDIHNKPIFNSIWKDLPPEVLENVLACLPIDELCRLRLVCKEWNHLISQPRFATLRTLSPHKASSILISPKLICRAMPTSSKWQVLYPMEKRSYKLSDSIIIKSYLSTNRNKGLMDPWWHLAQYKYTLAAAGEFIYIMYSDWLTMRRMHIVCNLVSKSFHEIPELPKIRKSPEILEFYHRDIVVMSVDNATQTYKIVSMEMWSDTTKPRNPNLFLYESVTSTWRKLCKIPNAKFFAYSSIFMNGILYTLFVDLFGTPTLPMSHAIVLYTCDLVTGVWCKVDVDFPPLSNIEEYLQLVVSSGQLYMVKLTSRKKWMVTLSIWKVVFKTKEVVQVAKIQNFCKFSRKMFHLSKVNQMPVAVGCADSIIILCKEGHCIKFDLLKKHWQELPDHTLDKSNGLLAMGICAFLVDF